jgi:hypothetical protein
MSAANCADEDDAFDKAFVNAFWGFLDELRGDCDFFAMAWRIA